MHAALLVLASAVVGVDWGYRPLPTGGIEYIVQLEPRALDDLAAGGGEIVSHVPPDLFDVRQFRLTVGKQKLPRGGRVATPSKQQTAAEGVQVTPAALTGGGNEHVVELDRPSIEQMQRSLDLVYEVENVRRYRIRLLPAPAPTRVEQVSAAMAEPSPAEPTRPGPTPASPVPSEATRPEGTRQQPSNVPSPRPSPTPIRMPMPAETELGPAPPFVPTGAVRDPNPLPGDPHEKPAREDAPRELPGVAKRAGSEPMPAAEPGPAKITAPAPKNIPLVPEVAPEPLKIDFAPSPDRSPRPLQSGDESAASPTRPGEKTKAAEVQPPDAFASPALPKTSVDTKPDERPAPTLPINAREPFPGDVPALAIPQRSEEPLPKAKPASTATGQPADWPPVQPTNPPAATDVASPKAKEPSKPALGGAPVEDNPFASPPNAVPAPTEGNAPMPKTPAGIIPAATPKSPAATEEPPHGDAPPRGPGLMTEPREDSDRGPAVRPTPPAAGGANDPFAPVGDNPLREPQHDAPPAGLRSAPGNTFGVGTEPPKDDQPKSEQPKGASPATSPTESSSPDRARVDSPASEIMPPALGGFPPLSTPSVTAAPVPSETAKEAVDNKSPPTNSPPNTNSVPSNDPFPSPFGGAPLPGVGLPGNETASKAQDGPPNSSGAPPHVDPFPAFGAPPTSAGSTSPPLGGPAADAFSTSRAPNDSSLSNGGARNGNLSDGSPTNGGENRPPLLPRSSFDNDPPTTNRAANDRPQPDQPQRATLGHNDEPAGPVATASSPPDKKPWWALTGAMVVLFGSLGGNVYLGWMNWDLRRQYAALLDTFKQQRANQKRAA